MYKMMPWSEDLDLSDFYAEAERRGFVNNATQKMLVDSLAKEDKWCVWVLYYNNTAVGTVGAHSLPELGDNAYRICARTCAFTDMMPIDHLRTREGITSHQNVTAQFFIPQCIEWVGEGDMYITTHPSEIGTQRLVHTVWGPSLALTGCLTLAVSKEYRGHVQTFWKLNKDVFLDQLDKVKKW
jgi:hypothetical protein